jgi:hypothetical protein
MAQERQEAQDRQESQELVISNVATNDVCDQSGPYRSNTTPMAVVFVKKGERFPNAPSSTTPSGQPATWTLISGTQTSL